MIFLQRERERDSGIVSIRFAVCCFLASYTEREREARCYQLRGGFLDQYYFMSTIRRLSWETKSGTFSTDETIPCIIGSISGYVYCLLGHKTGVV